jgi:sec-independent protein translocase protein TatA
MPVSVGPMELILVLAIALIVLGPKRLPEAGKALGKGLREFKDSVSGLGANDDDDEEEGEPSKLPADRTAAPH